MNEPEDWRERVAARERDPHRNCKCCDHYVEDVGERPPVCLKWSRIDRRVYPISRGFSGERNNAPFCQHFEARP